jgi:hypothetical protein
MSLLCRLDRHRWCYHESTDYGTLTPTTVTVRRCTRKRCPLAGRTEVVSVRIAGLAYTEEAVTRHFNRLRDEYRGGKFWPDERDPHSEEG